MVKLSIIILTFNTKELTLECIKSIFQEYEKELKTGEFEIILVDNASTDGTVDAILDIKYPDIKIIKNKENLIISKILKEGRLNIFPDLKEKLYAVAIPAA